MQQKKSKLNKVFNKAFIVYATIVVFLLLQIYFFIPSIRNNQWVATPMANPSLQAFKNPGEKKSIEQNMKGVHLLENDQKKKGWELFAEEASGSKEEQWLLKRVKVRFYTDEMNSFTVVGDVGEVDGKSKDMIIRGNVLTESSNGYFFETSELRYRASEKKLYSSDYVNMKGPPDNGGAGLVLTGQGLEILVAESKIKILNQVEARKTVSQKKFNVTSDSSVFSNRDREALFSGHVHLQYDTMNLKAGFSEFKYSKTKETLEIVRVYDHVTMVDQNKSGSCVELIVNLLNDTMTMNGNPRVQMEKDEIQGEQIIFSDRGKKVKISRMKLERKQK